MLARVLSCAIVGLEGAVVEVEVDLAERGLFFFAMVGLPDAAVQESKERVRAAIKNSGGTFWYHRIAVNLAPADLRKEGPSYDLPIAVGILMASGQVPSGTARQLYLGELSLDGSVRHANGVLPMVALAREKGIKRGLRALRRCAGSIAHRRSGDRACQVAGPAHPAPAWPGDDPRFPA